MSLTTKDKNDDSSITTTNYADNPNLSPIEQKILQQYQLMNNNLLKISNELELLTNTTDEFGKGKGSSIQLVENLRQLETKLVFVYTFFKGAVYSILNAQDYIAEQETNGLGGINEGTNEEEEEDDESGNVELSGVSADEN
ncbi:subunit of Dam1 complex (aka DASH complex), putative [Candida dubliniensis CD36]|uniref:DASH complex subunit DAD3 n=1 Tax=Candida dubliniensis (strain CD36 / ATCC MYA-646 / CBS 7987 / NCPF 3949 / NRRL Y-17841) TaxID=573826 RepID=B9WM33_CANDC|nr:subunit of Dam1 complex (aka DASH complex), putative [Candida dubliniensis CD36]CAX40146.1 subunit of Dam1 complex (aka DASH complex), putative [Candida dubliniensis CD36]